MRRFETSRSGLVVLFIGLTGPLYAGRLNPVSWSLQAPQHDVAPGSKVLLRLHAQIEDGYHLYSFTTPGGGPIKTRASLQPNRAVIGFTVYQPKPERYQDPNLKVPVETFKSGADFLLLSVLADNASAGETVLSVNVRYQACSDELCLPPVTKTATASVTVKKGAAAAKISVPSGYQLVGGSGAMAASSSGVR